MCSLEAAATYPAPWVVLGTPGAVLSDPVQVGWGQPAKVIEERRQRPGPMTWQARPSKVRTGCVTGMVRPFVPCGKRGGLRSSELKTWRSRSGSTGKPWRGLG